IAHPIKIEGSKVANSLSEAQALAEERAFAPENLHRAAAPAQPLRGKTGEGLRGKTAGQRAVVIEDPPALLLKPQAGVHVLGDGLGGKAADILEGFAPDDSRTTAIEGSVITVFAGLNHAEEEFLLLPSKPRPPIGDVLERIHVVEVLA